MGIQEEFMKSTGVELTTIKKFFRHVRRNMIQKYPKAGKLLDFESTWTQVLIQSLTWVDDNPGYTFSESDINDGFKHLKTEFGNGNGSMVDLMKDKIQKGFSKRTGVDLTTVEKFFGHVTKVIEEAGHNRDFESTLAQVLLQSRTWVDTNQPTKELGVVPNMKKAEERKSAAAEPKEDQAGEAHLTAQAGANATTKKEAKTKAEGETGKSDGQGMLYVTPGSQIPVKEKIDFVFS